MSIQVDLSPEIEAKLAAQAQREGVPVSQYVQRILQQHVPVQRAESAKTPEQRVRDFDDWAENFPYRRNKPLPDDAITRESFYRPDGG